MSLRRAILSLGGGVGTSVELSELRAPGPKSAMLVGKGAGTPPVEVLIADGAIPLGDVAETSGVKSQLVAGFLARIASDESVTGAWDYSQELKALQYATTNNGTVLLESGANTRLRSDTGDVEFQTTFGFVAFKAASGLLSIPVAVVSQGLAVGPDLGGDEGGFWTLTGSPTKPQFTDNASADHPLAMTDVATTWTQDHIFQGNVTIQGDTIQATSETLLGDNHILLNAGYTSDPAQTCGLIGLNDPTTTVDTVATGGFTAGVAAVSNPTVITTGTATFAASDIVQITDANDPANNGIYEVLSHVGTTLTVRGIGLTARVEDFTQNNFVPDTTVAGAITKSNVSVHRCGLDGLYETAQGSVTGFSFLDYALLAGQLGGAATAPDVRGIRTTTGPTLLTFGAIADGEFLKRVGATVVGGSAGALDNNFVFAYDTTTQVIAGASTYQGLDFSNNGELDGWTHTVNTSIFGCNQTGKYRVALTITMEKSTGGTAELGMRALFNAVEVPGSMTGEDLVSNNVAMTFSKSFIVNATSGQNLEIEIASTTTNVSVVPAPDPGGATADVSASIEITRIT